MIPTSTAPVLQKYNSIPTTSTTIVPNIHSVRNTSPNITSNYSTPRSPSLKQLTTNYIISTSTQLDHTNTHFRSNLINSSIPTSTLPKSTVQKLDTTSNNINTKSISELKKTKKKYNTFLRKCLSSPYIKNTPDPINTTNDLHIPINK